MKLASSKLCFLVASAAVFFTGCPKRPARPTPMDTGVIGQGVGPSTRGAEVIPTIPPEPGLIERGDGFGPDNQNRTALGGSSVYFDLDQSAIKQSEREKLKTAKAYLDTHPGERLLLEGHCDWRGSAEYNLGLGDRRAAAAKKYLLSLGVPADRLETLSKGNLDAKTNADAATMEKDRRVDLVVTRAK
ncbi:MAG: hypothetical protein RLZZ15_2543 [Verrucomicrobiota bacterium]|jgi:peptidoglycan-associated lipoprotein